MKNKSVFLIMLTIIAILALGCLYLAYKVYSIFGIWTMMWTGVVSWFSMGVLSLFVNTKTVDKDSIKFNPKEWPKYLSFLVSGLIGYYLFLQLESKTISSGDYIFGIAYLIILILIPILYGLIKLIRDRNDELIITSSTISFKDNSNSGEISINQVVKGESIKGGYRLNLKDGGSFDIPFGKMGFGFFDIMNAVKEINLAIKPAEESKESTEI